MYFFNNYNVSFLMNLHSYTGQEVIAEQSAVLKAVVWSIRPRFLTTDWRLVVHTA